MNQPEEKGKEMDRYAAINKGNRSDQTGGYKKRYKLMQ